MAIKDLKSRQGNVDLTFEIIEKGDIREFDKFGKKGKVCNAVAKDATGTVKITLWNDDIDKVKTGDTVKIENGWVGEWQGELQLSTGKFGKLTVIGSAGSKSMALSASEDEMEEADVLSGKKSDMGEHILTDDEKTEEETLDNLDQEPPLDDEISYDEEEIEEMDEGK